MLRNILIAAVATASVGTAAQAALVLDVQVAGGGKTATVADVGDVVSLDIFVNVTGNDANPDNEGFQSILGKLQSSTGGLQGNLALTLLDPFTVNAQAGTVQDLDADGDLDIGGTNTGNTTGWVYARASSVLSGNHFHIATATFTASSVDGSTEINFFERLIGFNGDGNWREDAGAKADLSFSGGVIQSAAPVVVSAVPEPTALALIGLPAAALLRRRRSI